MTDFELSKAIAELVSSSEDWEYIKKQCIGHPEWYPNYIADYPNNWNDLMSLVDKYKISSYYDEGIGLWYFNQHKRDEGGDYLCETFENDIENKSLSRGYAETLLKVLEMNK